MSLRLYEELFIVKPDSTDEQVDPLIDQMKQLIEKEGGKVEFSEKWGTRKLAYQVGRYREGTVTVEFVDRKENKLVWQGAVQDIIPEKDSKLEKTIKKGVDKLFASYPASK